MRTIYPVQTENVWSLKTPISHAINSIMFPKQKKPYLSKYIYERITQRYIIAFINSVQSAESQNEQKNDENGNHQSNKTNRNDMNSSVNTDEYSVLEFQPQKIEYTRSQLMQMAAKSPLKMNENTTKIVENNLMRVEGGSANVSVDKGAVGGNEPSFNDDSWNKATTASHATNKYPEPMAHEFFGLDYQAALAKAATDDRFGLPFSATSKVDRWLNSGQNPSEYAQATYKAEPTVQPVDSFDSRSNTLSTIKADETSSTVSNHSAIRAKLLDKTAKLKQNLRKLTNNNQE